MTKASDDESRLADRYALASLGACCLALVDDYLLGPLTQEERVEFRKNYLRGMSSMIDELFRGDVCLELLGRLCGKGRGRGAAATVADPTDEVVRLFRDELLKPELRDILRQVLSEQAPGRCDEEAAAPSRAAGPVGGPRSGDRPHPDSDPPPQEALTLRLLQELQEMKRELQELSARPTHAAPKNGRSFSAHPEES